MQLLRCSVDRAGAGATRRFPADGLATAGRLSTDPLRSALLALLLAACSTVEATVTTPPPVTVSTSISTTTPTTSASTTTSTTTTSTTSSTTTVPATTTTTLPPGVTHPPDWLGTRPLPLDESGNPVIPPTPDVLVDRRFTTPDILPPPDGEEFRATRSPVAPEIVARSTWEESCPIALEDLAYLTLTFWGFDQRPHTGEMIVNAEVADDVIGVFEDLYDARFPIEEMRISTRSDLEAEPTGDGNLTESFVCRPATGNPDSWSNHAFGLAIDINPFHNPYLRGDVIIPELATAYLDRERVRPGMIVEGDEVTQAFDAIGWGWGGRWSTLDDWQHFSRSGT